MSLTAAFVARLQEESLARVCKEFRVGEEEARADLSKWRGAADLAPWWPEALRRLGAGESIRAVARAFGTEPRRVRRGLARTGLRVGGSAPGPDGVAVLLPLRDRLGQVADGVLAREAGVIPEAVQGERRRLGVAAFHQTRATPRLTEDEEAWVRGPVKGKRERHRVDPDALTVVRRPARTEPAPPVLRTGVVIPGEARAPESFVERRRPAEPAEDASPAWRGPERRTRDFFWDDRRSEIDALLQAPRREREGRQRIVRADAPRDSFPIEVERRRVPRGDAPAWRTVPAAEAEKVVETVAPPSPLPRPPAALPRPPAAPAPVPRAPTVATVAPPPAPRPAPPVVPVVVPEPPSPLPRWELRLSGEETGLVVEAPDVAEAAVLIAARLPPFLHEEVGIHRVDGG